jgi:hypothetical protein
VLQAVGVSTLTVDLWVDGLGRPVKVTTPLTGKAAAPTTVSFSAFNRPVKVVAPAVDDVDTGD